MRISSLSLPAAVAALIAAYAALGAPATAAGAPVGRADASAVTLSVAGQGGYSGSYRATVSGDGTTSTAGSTRPALDVLGGQSLLSAGTLAQDARATLVDHAGHSVACAGLAGQGATLVAVGSGDCLTGGQALDLAAGSLDLSHLSIVRSTMLQGLDQQLQQALQPVLGPVTTALNQALQQGTATLGNPGLHVSLGAVQAHCQASPGSATGGANLADVRAWVTVPGMGDVDLVRLPVDPAPNTKVVTNLGAVATAVENALRPQLKDALDGALAPLATGIDQAAVLNNVLDQISAQLAPLQQNVLSATLNEQTRGAGSIRVTALHLQVLPAAKQFVNAPAVDLSVGRVDCGPSGHAADTRPAPSPSPTPAPAVPVAVPTRIPSGLASAPASDDGSNTPGDVMLGVLGAAAVGGGVLTFRRALRR